MNVSEKVRAIAAAIDGTHERFTRPTVRTPHDHAGTITGSDDAELFIRSEGGRLIITGTYPDRMIYGRGAKFVKITVAADRDPVAVAKEIVRRVLPGYLPELAKVQERIKEGKRDEQERKAAAAVITTHPLIAAYGTTGTYQLTIPGPRNDYIQFRINDDGSSAYIERGTLPTGLLLALADRIPPA